jgi:hypothetical protein
MSLEAGLDGGEEAMVVRFLKERFQAVIELLQDGGCAPALQKAELRDDPHFSTYILDVEDAVPVRCQLPSPGQAMFAQPSVFGIREELFDDLLPLWGEVSAVVCGASAWLRSFPSHGKRSARAETSSPPPPSSLSLPAQALTWGYRGEWRGRPQRSPRR